MAHPPMAHPPTANLPVTPSLNGIPTEIRDDIFSRPLEGKSELPMLVHAYKSSARKRWRENFSTLFFAGGAIKQDTTNM